MDSETRRLLEENLAVAKNNNDLLRSLRHHQWLSTVFSAVFWIAVIVAPLYFYQQYLAPILKSFGYETSGNFSLPSSADIQKLIDSFKAP